MGLFHLKAIMRHANLMCVPLKMSLLRVSAWRPMHRNVACSLFVWTGETQPTSKGYAVKQLN